MANETEYGRFHLLRWLVPAAAGIALVSACSTSPEVADRNGDAKAAAPAVELAQAEASGPSRADRRRLAALGTDVVAAEELDDLRGGFAISTAGMLINVAIAATTTINGEPASQFLVDNGLVGGVYSSADGLQHLVQIGPNNLSPNAFDSTAPFSVIQNTLDNLTIDYVRTIQVSVENYSTTMTRRNMVNSLTDVMTTFSRR